MTPYELIDTIEEMPSPLKQPLQQLMGHINGLKLLHNATLEKEIRNSNKSSYVIRHITDKMLEMRVLYNKETGQLIANLQRCIHEGRVYIPDLNKLGIRSEMWSCIVNARYYKAADKNWPIPLLPICEAIDNYLTEFCENIDILERDTVG